MNNAYKYLRLFYNFTNSPIFSPNVFMQSVAHEFHILDSCRGFLKPEPVI